MSEDLSQPGREQPQASPAHGTHTLYCGHSCEFWGQNCQRHISESVFGFEASIPHNTFTDAIFAANRSWEPTKCADSST